MTTPFNQFYRSPYLKTQWMFPNDQIKELSSQLDKAYVDIALKVNARVIGIFPQGNMVVTGEKWFLNGNTAPGQTLRREYIFGAITAGETDIPTNLPRDHGMITKITGTVKLANNTDWRPLPYIDPAATTNSIIILVGLVGGVECIRVVVGATFPAIAYGIITLEWLDNKNINFIPDPTV